MKMSLITYDYGHPGGVRSFYVGRAHFNALWQDPHQYLNDAYQNYL